LLQYWSQTRYFPLQVEVRGRQTKLDAQQLADSLFVVIEVAVRGTDGHAHANQQTGLFRLAFDLADNSERFRAADLLVELELGADTVEGFNHLVHVEDFQLIRVFDE